MRLGLNPCRKNTSPVNTTQMAQVDEKPEHRVVSLSGADSADKQEGQREGKGLMSLRRRLDHFKDVAFLLGSSENLPKHLSSCENPRLKLENAFIAFDIITVGRPLIFPCSYAL